MATDSTYRFFRREFDGGDGSAAPVINTARVVKRGGLRGGSVPPVHLGARPSRSASVPPPRGFVRPTPIIHTVASISHGGAGSAGGSSGGRRSIAVPSTSIASIPFASLSGYQAKPVARRASIAAPGGSTIRIWSVGSGGTSSSSPSLNRGLTEVTKGSSGFRPVYRPSAQTGFGRSTASSSVRVGLPQGGAARSVGGGASFARSRGQSLPLNRWASVSGYGGSAAWDEDLDPLPPVKTLQRSSYVGGGGGGGDSRGRAVARTTERYPLSANRFNVRANDVTSSGEGFHYSGKTSDNDVHHRKKLDYEKQMEDLLPQHEDSLAKLRARAQVAKEHLSRHRILLDRYLPVQLGPENDVVDEVESKYGELLSRMPHLDKRQKSNRDSDEYISVIAPYKPASVTTKGPKLSYDIANTTVSKSFTPKISDTRKRARSVLCKVKGDPKYFDF